MIPLTDANTGLQLAFENVAILFTRHEMYAATYFDMQLVSKTKVAPDWYCCVTGKLLTVSGNPPEKNVHFNFSPPRAIHLAFNPGKTWFIIVGSKSTLTTPPDAMWVLDNTLP